MGFPTDEEPKTQGDKWHSNGYALQERQIS